ncbi:ATP-dependent DNA helicase RecG [Candidatus Shapirobacteria bacterium CG10_big_fil_rev_8_21_14_0_10_48_15]|uniref:ATP-dependent DNA helicase RecG n=1 Tax=Candidatus Shapirobacteria bacterium CG10_big_fil_rev_8_21_14_0_10_48_15 TaxID=1974484 RepID=A0A2M8L772_9BACT|nr:MAG: ATP-dependent DNA helicase RecG [Candidatus Shapirobacteria bacterium CG10_big_fil_rev_8_21_14_0_10_48_15]
MTLGTPISRLFMVGPAYTNKLGRLNINTVGDLLYHFPFRYLDYSLVSPLGQVQAGETVSVKGQVLSFTNQYTRRRQTIQKAVISDGTGQLQATWFNQPFLKTAIKTGQSIFLAGKVEFFGSQKIMTNPDHELVDQFKPAIHTGRLVPIYHETTGVSSKWLRSRIAVLLRNQNLLVEEFLPSILIEKNSLAELRESIEQIHLPNSLPKLTQAKQRLAFDEMFLLQLAALSRQKAWQQKKLVCHFQVDAQKLAQFIKSLPFPLTAAQTRAIGEIMTDLQKDQPMNRLLEGDVGSGKTVVAAAAIFIASLNKVQAALMVPTEVLANQHFLTLNQLLTPLGIKIKLLTGSTHQKQVDDFDFLIGTHALIHQRAVFKKLGLAIVDEQHRFGVGQRAQLINQNRQAPHLLTMTATPIPRTIALTVHGDLDLSVLDEMPPGRQKIKTWLVPAAKRRAAYAWIRQEIQTHRSQAFIVCPFIEESTHESLQSVRAAKNEFTRLQTKIFPQLKLGLLHGRLKSTEKVAVLKQFQQQKIAILVATPVVEVGLDIPNATIMMVEGAQRFGLAQLHQLRGRVGRGEKQAYCLLFGENLGHQGRQRLQALQQAHTGMELAEIDLQMRGPGQVYGTSQHGFFALQLASFTDHRLIKQTRQAAALVMPSLSRYPRLQAKLKEYKINQVEPN